MVPESFTEFFKSLDESGRETVIKELLSMVDPSEPDLHTVHCEVQQSQSLHCPNCQDIDIRANGKANGVQRYFCKSCKKYFRETTGKVTFGLKKGNLLSVYLYHMLLGNSIKKCAEQTGICIQTSFDWRHKILSAFEGAVPDGFEGIVESDDIFFLESGKGKQGIT